MALEARRTLNALVVVQALAIGIAVIYMSAEIWAMGLWLVLLVVAQWRLRQPMTARQGLALLSGAALWGMLAYVNRPLEPMRAREALAAWTFIRFFAVLWFSVLILRATSLWALVSHLEWALKRVIGPRAAAGELALMALVAMRFIPVLGASARHLRADARMRRQLAGNPARWNDALRFVMPLVMASILRSENVAEALWTRGWRSGVTPWPKPWTARDWAATGTLWLFLIIAWKEKI